MTLRKDDPIYYKKKITELINQARENDLLVYINENEKCLSFKCKINGDTASVLLDKLVINNTEINISNLCEPNPIQEMVKTANDNYMKELLKKYGRNVYEENKKK